MKELDLAINNGKIVNASGSVFANVGVLDGRIVAISDTPLQAEQVIDATDRWVLPGVIDTHVHFALKQGQGEDAITTKDDYESGPIASATGGVTTFLDYAIPLRDQSPKAFLEERIALADEGSCIDFGFHAGVTNPDPAVFEEFPEIVEMGIPSFKFFLPYREWGFGVGLGYLMEAMRTLRDLGAVTCVHAEHDEIVVAMEERCKEKSGLRWHSRSRPPFSEEIGVYELVALARELEARLYIVHLSTEKALKVIRQAQREGVPVRTETCPHYLTFTDEIYDRPEGLLYIVTPPLRPPGNRESLWQGIQDHTISQIASDHNALGWDIKRSQSEHWSEVPPGMAGSELLLTFLHSEGVTKGRVRPERMVELLSANPAAMFGVPNKGWVRVGYDADLVIFDPDKTQVAEDLATVVATPFDGMEMTGWPTHTISRGEVIVEERDFVGEKGRGRFIERNVESSPIW